MNIGDSVKYVDPLSDTLYGVIVDKKTPRCKCKGGSYWIIDFNGETKQIKVDDNRLSLHNIEPTKGSLGFNFM